jgi:gamma-glutamyltranspeptidase/glutathione hydrolase
MRKLLLLLVSLVVITNAGASPDSVQPEAAGEVGQNELVYGKNQMVVTNNPLASSTARDILIQGGNAFDAAIAAAFVLGLVEPQSSGIGGGGYALTYSAKTKNMFAYDGREVAPQAANPNWFLSEGGQPMSFTDAMLSPRSIGVPGEVAMFYKLSKDQGRLPWAKLLQPAINLANNGFPMSPRLYGLLALENDKGLLNDPKIKAVYFESDQVKAIGSTVINRGYANTLSKIAKNTNNFYRGQIATDIINIINNKAQDKLYTKSDLKGYKVQRYNGVCIWYRDKYQVCSVPPSSGGGVTVMELMKIYANNYSGNGSDGINWVYNFAQASKLAFADRNQYLADPKFVRQPVWGLLSDDYINSRSKLVASSALKTPVAAGIPVGADKKYAPDTEPKGHGTTSLAIVDNQGNAISMTVTVEHQFGSHVFVDGFFLNNELTDFSFNPVNKAGKPVANRVEAKKRPRSSISPVIVFDQQKNVYMLTGSPGGSQIICYVAKNLIQVLDLHMDIAHAIASPNLCAANGALMIEADSDLTSDKSRLEKLGESVIISPLVSGEVTIIKIESGGWFGAADPRREGIALGN